MNEQQDKLNGMEYVAERLQHSPLAAALLMGEDDVPAGKMSATAHYLPKALPGDSQVTLYVEHQLGKLDQ